MTPNEIIQVICEPLYEDAQLELYVQMAKDSLNRCFFGKMYDYAVAYKACHLYTVNGGGEDLSSTIASLSSGAVTGMREGGLSIDFGAGNGKASELNSTKYGRQLLELMKRPTMGVNTNPLFCLGGC